MHTQVLAAFFVYFIVLLSIGLIAHRKQSSASDFIIGNRSLNFWLTALSAHASDMSAWLFMAFPAAIFLGGVQQVWAAFGLVIGMFCNWHFVAKKLRDSTEWYESLTLSTFFENRFNDKSGTVRILTAVMTIIFLTSYLSAGLIAMGLLLESVFGIDYYLGLTIALAVAMTYTFVGGFVTVAWTDLFQAVFLLVVILIVPVIAYMHVSGGVSSIEAIAAKNGITLTLFEEFSGSSVLTILFLMLGWGLGYFGQPHIITKFMGIKDSNEIYKSKYLGMTWQSLALLAAIAIGLVGIGFFPNGLENPELVFVNMVKTLFTPFFAGIILCAVIAANMSTMDSQILVCASVLSEDFYKHMVHRAASQKQLLLASRIAVIAISLVALAFAFDRHSTVLEVVFYAWSGLGCAFGPLVLMSLYSSHTNKYGAIAGILTGGAIAGIWPMINDKITSIEVPAMVPGFSISLLSIYVVSRLFPVKAEQRSA